MKFSRFTIFLFLCCFSQLQLNAQISEADTTRVRKYLNDARSSANKRQFGAATKALVEAKKIIDQRNLQTIKYDYLKLEQKILYKEDRYQEAKGKAIALLKFSKGVKDNFKIAESYYSIALCQLKLKQLNVAIENVIAALKVSEDLKNYKQKQGYYYTLSLIFFELGDQKKMLYYDTKAREYAIAANNAKPKVDVRLDDALNHIAIKKPDLAIKYANEALSLARQGNDKWNTIWAYLFLRHAYFLKKDYFQALSYLQKITPLLDSMKDKASARMHVECAYAETYFHLGDYTNARKYFSRNIKLAEKHMNMSDLKDMYQLGANIYEKSGDIRTAFGYLKSYKIFIDSISKVSTARAIHESEIKYQTTLKEKAISEQKLQLLNKDYELHDKNKYLLVGVIVIILLICAAAVTYLIYRNKTQSIELMLLKAQIHPHFLFNTLNNLYALTINKADEAPKVVLEISTILRYILYECNTLKADLSKELSVIQHFIALEKIRFKHRLEVNVNMEGDFTNRKIVPLLILPLVENAFKHGVAKLMEDAWINIEAKVKDDKFIFKISNNKPIASQSRIKDAEYGNIGLLNIKKRLSILYPKTHKLKVIDEDDVFIVLLELSKL